MAQPSPVSSRARKTQKAPAAVFPARRFGRQESTGLWWQQIRSGEHSTNGIIASTTHTRIIHRKGRGAHAPQPEGVCFTLPVVLTRISFHNLLLASAGAGAGWGDRGCPVISAETVPEHREHQSPWFAPPSWPQHHYSILGTATAPSAQPKHPEHRHSILSTTTASSAPPQHPHPAPASPVPPLSPAPCPQQWVGDSGNTTSVPFSPHPFLFYLSSNIANHQDSQSKPAQCLDHTPAPSSSAMETCPQAAGVGGSTCSAPPALTTHRPCGK